MSQGGSLTRHAKPWLSSSCGSPSASGRAAWPLKIAANAVTRSPNLSLDAHAGDRDRRCRSAGRQIRCLASRPTEGPVHEEIVGLAVEEFRVGGLLAGPDRQRSTPERL